MDIYYIMIRCGRSKKIIPESHNCLPNGCHTGFPAVCEEMDLTDINSFFFLHQDMENKKQNLFFFFWKKKAKENLDHAIVQKNLLISQQFTF